MMWLMVLSLVYLAFRTWWAIHEYPDTRQEQIRFASAWASLWFFLIVARWLDERRIPVVVSLAFISLIIGIFQEKSWSDLTQLVAGVRGGFGYGIPQAGLYSATAVVGVLAFSLRSWQPDGRGRLVFYRIVLWAVAFAISVEMLLITQSRISWLASVVGILPILVLVLGPAVLGKEIMPRNRVLIMAVVLAALVTLPLLVNYAVIGERLVQSAQSLEVVGKLGAEDVAPADAVAERVQLIRHGFTSWSERPIFGWGPGTRVAFDAKYMTRQLGHLHNTYLEMLVRLGLVGASLFGIAFFLIFRASWQAFREKRIALDIFAFVLGTLLVLSIWFGANFRLGSEVRFVIVLLCAVGYSAAWRQTPITADKSSAAALGNRMA
jgi:O-antigen ligase